VRADLDSNPNRQRKRWPNVDVEDLVKDLAVVAVEDVATVVTVVVVDVVTVDAAAVDPRRTMARVSGCLAPSSAAS